MGEEKEITVNYSRKFLKDMSKLPSRVIEQAKEREKIVGAGRFG